MRRLAFRSRFRSRGLVAAAFAQDIGTLAPKPLPPLEHPDDPHNAAKQVFGREFSPTEAQSRSIGFYSHGCLAGGEALPLDGDTWRVMRVSRNRYWGNPETIAFLNASRRRRPTRGSGPASSSATFRSRAAARC